MQAARRGISQRPRRREPDLSEDERDRGLREDREEAGPPRLERDELEAAEERQGSSAPITYEVIRRAGEKELRRPPQALAFSGLAGGLSMGFSFLTQALIASHLPDVTGSTLLSKLGYPVGFLIVILGSQQLFTENTLTAVIPLLAHRTSSALRGVIRLWSVVLIANLVGGFLFVLLLTIEGLFDPAITTEFDRIGRNAFARSWLHTMLFGVLAGWLIAMMVWMLPAARSAGVIVIFVVTYVVGLADMPHIVVGSIDVFYLVATGVEDIGHVLGSYMLPTLLGNIIGGVALVSALNHAQVVAGEDDH